MKRKYLIIAFLACFFLSFSKILLVKAKTLEDREAWSLRGATTIYVDTAASTWKPRGLVLHEVGVSVRMKLDSAGFNVTRIRQEPHLLTLSVKYRETRGEPYGVNQFATVITGDFHVDHHTVGPVFDLTVQETAHPSISGTPPYLDALHNFETNPYYYFLGDLIWWRIQKNFEAHTVFLMALKDDVLSKKTKGKSVSDGTELETPDSSLTCTGVNCPHSMLAARKLYAPIVIRRTLEELVHAKDSRLVPLLFDLVGYPDAYVRIQAIKAFESFQVAKSLPLLQSLISNDLDVETRQAAEAALDAIMAAPSLGSP